MNKNICSHYWVCSERTEKQYTYFCLNCYETRTITSEYINALFVDESIVNETYQQCLNQCFIEYEQEMQDAYLEYLYEQEQYAYLQYLQEIEQVNFD